MKYSPNSESTFMHISNCVGRAIFAVLMFIIPLSAVAQGSLTPPAAPGPTMKSLDQIEARTPISSAPFTITTSGSYYLTTNVTVSSGDAITISANNVTLDLNGFTISSTRPVATTDTAILLSGPRTNISIYNGYISGGVTNSAGGVFGGSGFASGIIYSTVPPSNVRVKDVSISGVLFHGIVLNSGNSTVVESCTVQEAGGYGIVAASISDSTALNCGLAAVFGTTVKNCAGYALGSANGVNATTANNCYGTSSGSGTGVNADVANNCEGQSFGSGNGLTAVFIATGCVGLSSSGIGLSAVIASVCHGQSSSGTALNVIHNVNSF
jgi:hypothetical protein